MKRITFAIIILLLSQSAQLKSNNQNFHFKRITINDGLSLSSVYCIFQDSRGFMWFGTEDGLNRYDGEKIKIYRSIKESTNSLTSKWIEIIHEDSNGNLWLGSRSGLTCFNPKTEQFIQFNTLAHPNQRLKNDTITKLFEDKNKLLWVGTKNGVDIINIELLQRYQTQNNTFRISSRVFDFVADNENNIWIPCNNGLYKYNHSTNSLEYSKFEYFNKTPIYAISIIDSTLLLGSINGLYTINTNNYSEVNSIGSVQLKNRRIESIAIDKQNRIWVGTDEGLYLKDNNKAKFTKIVSTIDNTNSLAINTNKPLLEDGNGNIWYGTFGNGLYKYTKNELLNFTNSPANQQSLSHNSTNCIYEDNNGNIWIGTFGAGISIYSPQAHKFKLIKSNPVDRNSLASNFVWSIFEDNNNNIWIGTNDAGLSVYNAEENKYTHYNFANNPAIRKVYQDSQGTMWVGTDGQGLFKFNNKNKKWINYRNQPNNSTSLSNNSVRVIFEDSKKRMWIGTREGLNRFDRKSGKCKRYLHNDDNSESLSNNFIYSSIFEDSKSRLWIGTYGGGFNIFDPDKEVFTQYRVKPQLKRKNSISDDVIFSFYEAPNGIFWIGTNNKLNKFDIEKNEFSHFGIEQGLPNDVIYGILPDNSGNIWLSTNRGICRFNTTSYSVKNFDVNDGLQSNEFNGGAFHKGHSGLMYFGGVYGLNIIDPNKDYREQKGYKPVITKISISGKNLVLPQTPDSITNNKVHFDQKRAVFLYRKSPVFADTIELDYTQREISMEFTSPALLLSKNIRYYYKMEGLEKEWTYAEGRNFVSFSNLKPGSYTFLLKATNNDGEWNSETKKIVITVDSPFWLSWWFIALEIMFVLVVIVLIYHYLIKLKTTKILTIQNQTIKATNAKLTESEKRLLQLNATKDTFFRIISHDLKNPFTSLMSVSESLNNNYNSINDNERKSGINKINNAVKQIYNLLENLLTWSQSQTGNILYNPKPFSIDETIKDSVSLYNISAEKKGITFVYNQKENRIAYGDIDMVNTILRNLISNAVKFSNSDTTIEINIEQTKNTYTIEVKDKGVGIEQKNIENLYRIDKKHKTVGTAGEKGTGLGLILCKEFVEKHNCNIWVKSEVGIGTSFYFTLPVYNEM